MNSWYKNKKSFAVLFIIIILVVVSLMVANLVKAWIQAEREKAKKIEEETLDMYNASRYFFRVYYPDDWNVLGGTNGFLIDSESGLVLEAFPLVENPITPEPTLEPSPTIKPTLAEGQTAKPTATPDPREGLVRYEYASAYFYYREYTDFGIEKKDPATIAPSATANATSAPATATPKADEGTTIAPTVFQGDSPVDLEDVFSGVVDYIESQSTDAVIYEVGKAKNVELGGKRFRTASYTYTGEDGFSRKGDIYVAVRKMAYYVIIFEGYENNEIKAYTKYSGEFKDILSDVLFSVFDY